MDNVHSYNFYRNNNDFVNQIQFDMEGNICPPFSMSNTVLLVSANRQIQGRKGGEKMEEKRTSLVSRKPGKTGVGQRNREKIREAYANANPNLEVIPVKETVQEAGEPRKLRVCGYCRVSTESDNQQGSFELQVQDQERVIRENPAWEFAGIYADEGISATSVEKRKEFLRMIEDCEAGKIDLIITKSVSRFARNLVDCISYIRRLKALKPPVGIYFQNDHLNTLDQSSEMMIAFMSCMAQEESAKKSEAVKYGIRKKFAVGIPLCPRVLGYDKDRDDKYFIVEEEARIVRLIYGFYIEGYSTPAIANALTRAGVPTITGQNTVWNSNSVLYILRNEKYCGDVAMQKTYIEDYLTHKAVKNTGKVQAYLLHNHHVPIIPKDEWEQVQELLANWKTRRKKKTFIQKKVITVKRGRFAGYIIIDPSWKNKNYME